MLDISKEPMEVAPTAHYSMGGISLNPKTHNTSVRGLFAAGEVAGGLHGAIDWEVILLLRFNFWKTCRYCWS